MSRRIVTTQFQANIPGTQVDTYFDRLLKYIPADIVGAWVAATGLITGRADIPASTILWLVFVIFVLITAVWTLKQTAKPNKQLAITQTSVSTGAFIVWVFALGGPFATLGFYQPVYGSLLLILYTLVVALINPPES